MFWQRYRRPLVMAMIMLTAAIGFRTILGSRRYQHSDRKSQVTSPTRAKATPSGVIYDDEAAKPATAAGSKAEADNEAAIRTVFSELYKFAQKPADSLSRYNELFDSTTTVATPGAIQQLLDSAQAILQPWMSQQFAIVAIEGNGKTYRIMVSQKFDFGGTLSPQIFTYNVEIEQIGKTPKLIAGNLENDHREPR